MFPGDGFVTLAEDLRVFPLYPWILTELMPAPTSVDAR
jgi:hypothetical protein